mgnify:CR=1 FL=1
MLEVNVAQEWEKVKDVPSLFKHYGSQAEYQRWRQRFLKAGYIQKSARTFAKKRKNPEEHRKAYSRAYARKWRERHPVKAKEIAYEHWKRKLLADFATVRLNPNEGLK